MKYGIDKLMCFSWSNITIEGDFYSDEFRYIDIKLIKCMNTSTS